MVEHKEKMRAVEMTKGVSLDFNRVVLVDDEEEGGTSYHRGLSSISCCELTVILLPICRSALTMNILFRAPGYSHGSRVSLVQGTNEAAGS